MNFFARQQDLRRMSVRLVVLFAIAVAGIIAAVDLAVLFAFNVFGTGPADLWATVGVTSLLTAGAIALATLYRMATLRGGGGRVARELGGDYVPQDTADPQLRRLRNVVEEIAIASGVPVPEIYVLQRESSINAFAAGWSTSDAAVAVTRGALDRLNRDELQGVIAHEFSHVVNGDMRLNIRLIGLLFGILFLAVAGQTILRAGAFTRSRDDRGGNPLPLIGIALVVAGFVGVVVGRLIKASVSRKREYLADASAVQFTRQTSGLAGALKKIAGLPSGSALNSPKTEEVGHMLFGSGAKRQSLFATHPPIADRLRALDPAFDPAQLDALAQRWAQSPPVGMREDQSLGLTPARTEPTPPPQGDLVEQIAAPTGESFRNAESLLHRLPEAVLARARSVEQVVPLVLGLLLSADPEIRARQLADLASRYGPDLADAASGEARALSGLDQALYLPLAELAFPALRHRPDADQRAVLDAIHLLSHADGRITTFEYGLATMLQTDMYQSLHPQSRGRTRSLSSSRREVVTLLAVLAQTSGPHAEGAFLAGVAQVFPRERHAYVAPAGILELDTAWPALRELDPAGKERLIRAVVTTVGHDKSIAVGELELIRTICAVLQCPLPALTTG